MKKNEPIPPPRFDVKEFGDVHELVYNVECDRTEAVGQLGQYDIAHLLEAMHENFKGSRRKVYQEIADLSKRLAQAVAKGCVSARTFAYVSNGPVVRLTSLDEDKLLAVKKETKAAIKKRAKEIEQKEKTLKNA